MALNSRNTWNVKRSRPKIGITRVRMGRGGSEARTMWSIEALKKDYIIDLITSGKVDLDDLNSFYGTEISHDEFTIRNAPIPHIITRNANVAAVRGALFQRFCRKIAKDYDGLISTYNLCDFGIPAIHCIADFSWDEQLRKKLHPDPQGFKGPFHRNRAIRKAYLKLAKVMSRPSGRDLFSGEDLILANSHWSADVIEKKYHANIHVLYPPVFSHFPKVPLEKKESGFVYIGRISPEKRIKRMIKILKAIRNKGHDIHLHLVGEIDSNSYGRVVKNLCRSEKNWIQIEGKQLGTKKVEILTQHRFGIHACQGEAFGISIAEMVKAGCIPFVPAGGGQREIVDHPALLFTSIMDAVDKIHAVLSNEKLQNDMRAHLKLQGKKFSAHHFTLGILEMLDKFLKTHKVGIYAL